MDAVSYVPDAITSMPPSLSVTVAQPSGSSKVMVSHPFSMVHSTTLSCVTSRGLILLLFNYTCFGPEPFELNVFGSANTGVATKPAHNKNDAISLFIFIKKIIIILIANLS